MLKQTITKKMLAILVAVAITVIIMPFAATNIVYAATPYDIADGNIVINWDGNNWLVNGSSVANSESDPIIITGTSILNTIVVDGGDSTTATPVYIQINNLTIKGSFTNPSVITLKGGADVFFSLEGNSNLGGNMSTDDACITVSSGTSITICGPGTLETFNNIGVSTYESLICGSITINSGTIEQIYGRIGGGLANSGPIVINGGTISSRGIGNTSESNITITGGTVRSESSYGAGIGSINGNNGIITITGGTVFAEGYFGGAGIGGGTYGDGGIINISGDAVVTAIGRDNYNQHNGYGGAGIGGGANSEGGTITISGNATVTATGGDAWTDSPDANGSGIGSGGFVNGAPAKGADITITGATVSAKAGSGPNSKMRDDIDTNGIVSGTLDIDGGALVTLEKYGIQPSGTGFLGECVIIDKCTTAGYTNLSGTYYSLSVTDGTAAFTQNSNWKSGIVKSGTSVTLTATALPNNVFAAWTYGTDTASCFSFASGNSAASSPASITPSQTAARPVTFKLTFAATFKQSPTYTVTFDSRSGSYVAPITGIAPDSTITAPDAPTRSGYKFAGWYKDAEGTMPWDFAKDTVTSDLTLYAKWEPVETTAPKTGDISSPETWILFSGIALACITAAVVIRKRNRLTEN